jgi:UDP-N-acetylglucosamine--N-acetylmuramyl-(pentapeptide) pyrophosphoryl-undecaprenol N-acetylglucosamine transferase
MPSTGDTANAPRRLRVCLAASGGGHVRQLLDLEPVWSQYDYVFVTEGTALGQTLADQHRTFFLPHFAWGQAKQGSPFKMAALAVKSFFRSLSFMLRERPDVVISTGAGAVIFPVLWGRLLGAHIVIVESFARFDHPSLFGRIAAPLAHDMVVQSPKLAARYPRAHVFDPFQYLDSEPPPKRDLLFATVGATLPFDRLVRLVETAKAEGTIPDEVLIQTGVGGRAPAGLEVRETLTFNEIQDVLRDARVVVCHGGTGSLITALRQGCHVIAVPRRSDLGEHYDDHQSEITAAFADRGLISVVNTDDEMREAMAATRERKPVLATTNPEALISFLTERLAGIGARLK